MCNRVSFPAVYPMGNGTSRLYSALQQPAELLFPGDTSVPKTSATTETHSSILAWRIPGAEEPGGLPSVESHRVGHD